MPYLSAPQGAGGGGGGGGKDIGCRVFNSASLSTSSGVTLVLTFDSERYDTDSMHSTTTNTDRITFTTGGTYVFGCSIQMSDVNTTGARIVRIRLNAAATPLAELRVAGISYLRTLHCHGAYNFAANDWIDCVVHQDSGADIGLPRRDADGPEFWAQKIDKGG